MCVAWWVVGWCVDGFYDYGKGNDFFFSFIRFCDYFTRIAFISIKVNTFRIDPFQDFLILGHCQCNSWQQTFDVDNFTTKSKSKRHSHHIYTLHTRTLIPHTIMVNDIRTEHWMILLNMTFSVIATSTSGIRLADDFQPNSILKLSVFLSFSCWLTVFISLEKKWGVS